MRNNHGMHRCKHMHTIPPRQRTELLLLQKEDLREVLLLGMPTALLTRSHLMPFLGQNYVTPSHTHSFIVVSAAMACSQQHGHASRGAVPFRHVPGCELQRRTTMPLMHTHVHTRLACTHSNTKHHSLSN